MDFSEKPMHQQYQYGDPSCDLLLFLLLQLLSLFGSYLVDKVYEHSCFILSSLFSFLMREVFLFTEKFRYGKCFYAHFFVFFEREC